MGYWGNQFLGSYDDEGRPISGSGPGNPGYKRSRVRRFRCWITGPFILLACLVGFLVILPFLWLEEKLSTAKNSGW